MLRLRTLTSPDWVKTVLGDFNSFLLDHAACERKASGMAMSFVAHYPDRKELVEEMIAVALEELEHFQQVYRIISSRGLTLGPDGKDPYVSRLLAEVRHGPDDYFLDRLLVAGVLEARGQERFGLIASALDAGPLKDFYSEITRSESQHQGLYLRFASTYFGPAAVKLRLEEFLDLESQILARLPIRPALH